MPEIELQLPRSLDYKLRQQAEAEGVPLEDLVNYYLARFVASYQNRAAFLQERRNTAFLRRRFYRWEGA